MSCVYKDGLVGAQFNDSGASNGGQTRVFEWNGSDWIQMGQDINGLQPNNWEGREIAINDAGDIIAVGAIFHDGQEGSDIGSVRVFHFDGEGWNQLGQSLTGTQHLENFGVGLDLNGANNKVVVVTLPPKTSP